MVQEIEGTCFKVSRYYPGITTKTELDERILSARRYVSDVIERLHGFFNGHYDHYGCKLR